VSFNQVDDEHFRYIKRHVSFWAGDPSDNQIVVACVRHYARFLKMQENGPKATETLEKLGIQFQLSNEFRGIPE
jgi:hypothetical protein